MKQRFSILFLFFFQMIFSQSESVFSFGFGYGFGDEIRKKDYAFSNHFVKLHLDYQLWKTQGLTYALVVQPEVNFAQHQLLNKYFVQPSQPNYEDLRDRFNRVKNIHEYILNFGVMVRKPISKTLSVYVLGSIGPMFTDTETERLSKGFAFSDVIALGVSFKADAAHFDFRPSLRHVSNAGLQSSNAGFNTQNIEMCVTFDL